MDQKLKHIFRRVVKTVVQIIVHTEVPVPKGICARKPGKGRCRCDGGAPISQGGAVEIPSSGSVGQLAHPAAYSVCRPPVGNGEAVGSKPICAGHAPHTRRQRRGLPRADQDAVDFRAARDKLTALVLLQPNIHIGRAAA
jgi:hypothetical protein